MQRSYTFAFFAVKDLLLLCCRYVKIFKTRKWHLKYSHGWALRGIPANKILLSL